MKLVKSVYLNYVARKAGFKLYAFDYFARFKVPTAFRDNKGVIQMI
jgi:hypothetical protein